MVQHNIYLQSSQSSYFAFEENSLSLGRTQAQQLKEIGRQCVSIARLDAEDWQQIGLAIGVVGTSRIRYRVRRQFFPVHRVLQQTAIALGQCLKLLALRHEDWHNMTNLLSHH
ncbi:MAG: hypothetical protein AB4290_18835 [Spirulina sp.]